MTAKKKIVPRNLVSLDETLSDLMEQLRKELKKTNHTSVGGKIKGFKLKNVLKYLKNARSALET